MRSTRWILHGPVVGALVAAVCSCAATVAAGTPPSVTIIELADDFSFGYQSGVKQVLGAYKDGLSVHQVSRARVFGQPVGGNPDYLFWVNEPIQTHGFEELPTGGFFDNVTNPGGMVAFDDEGYIWFTYSGRVQDLPPSLYRSSQPGNPGAFDLMLPDLVTKPNGSTTFLLHVVERRALLFWRERNSANVNAKLRARRYDIAEAEPVVERDVVLGSAMPHPQFDRVGIEQLWSRYDPRFGRTFITWQWFDVAGGNFGSNPFLYTDDQGETWRRADGTIQTQLPITYDHTDSLLVPFDHLAIGRTTFWYPRDLGIAPDGTPWIQIPTTTMGITHLYFEDGAWHPVLLTSAMVTKSSACGASLDYLVMLYAHGIDDYRTLNLRFSADGGRTWSQPEVVDSLDPGGPDGRLDYSWVSFIQPADAYLDNTARFIVGYYRHADGIQGLRYLNSIRWVKVELPEPGERAELTDLVIPFGIHVSGGLGDLVEADGLHYTVRSQFGFSATEPNLVDLRLGAAFTIRGGGETLRCRVKARLNNPGGRQTISLRNWSIGMLETVSERPIGQSDLITIVDNLGTESYIRPSDGRVEAALRYSVIATFSAAGFESSIDLVELRRK